MTIPSVMLQFTKISPIRNCVPYNKQLDADVTMDTVVAINKPYPLL